MLAAKNGSEIRLYEPNAESCFEEKPELGRKSRRLGTPLLRRQNRARQAKRYQARDSKRQQINDHKASAKQIFNGTSAATPHDP